MGIALGLIAVFMAFVILMTAVLPYLLERVPTHIPAFIPVIEDQKFIGS
jgi:type IV secretory pathway VirB3-like protein